MSPIRLLTTYKFYKFVKLTLKYKMKCDYQTKNGHISNKDVDEVIDYIYNALNNIT